MLSFSAFSALLLLVVISIRWFYIVNRLRHVPGPRLAAVTNLWRFYMMNQLAYGERMVQLHRKYGHLVRLGPNRVSTSDPAAIPIVFGTSPVWEKVSTPSFMLSFSNQVMYCDTKLTSQGPFVPSICTVLPWQIYA